MNKKLLIPLAISFMVFAAASSAVFSNGKTEKTSAYTSSSLPTTIYLKDPEESTIRNYYSDLLSLEDNTEKQGTNLLKNLKGILSTNQKYYNYDSGNAIWQMYEISDRDWVKSPASSITYGSYDSVNEVISNYQYGSLSEVKNNPYVRSLYVNRDVDNGSRAWDSHGDRDNKWTIEREHIWAKANGFDTKGQGGARGDPMHLWAANGQANGDHSNNYFGYVDTTKTYKDCGDTHSNIKGNLSGYSKTLGGSATVFEPQDSDKGDIARAIFYMAARYNAYAGSDSDTFDTNNPNLRLVQRASHPSSGFTSSGTNPGEMGILSDLLEWNRLDKPDAYEIHRNNILYRNFTNNRNPFIDFPEWADYIWGSYTSSDYARPDSDVLNDFSSGEEVELQSISLQSTAGTTVGKTVKLVPSFTPSNATNKSVTWVSSDTSVATVSGGVVTGVAIGTATITATSTVDNTINASCTVTVSEVAPMEDTKTITINYGDTFTPALPTKAADVNTEDTLHVDSSTAANNFNFKERGIYKGSSSSYIMFAENKGFIYNTVDLGTIESVSITYSSGVSTSTKTGVYFGSSIQSEYTTSSNTTIPGVSTTSTWTNDVEGNGYFQLSTSNKNCQITNIEIKYHPYLSSISVSGQTTEIYQNDEYDFDGVVTASFIGKDDTDVTSFANVSSVDTSEAGVQEVTVSYTYNGVTKQTSFDLTINEYNSIESVTLSSTDLRIDLNGTTTSQLTATVEKTGSQASTDVTWTSSDTSVATVSNNGLVTALSVGSTTITATSDYDTSMSASCVVTVIDSSVESDEITDVLNRTLTGVTSTTYSSWSGKVASSNAVYAGQSAGGNNSIQLRSSNSNSGVISTASGGTLKSVSVVWNSSTTDGRKINVYGSSTAYSSPTELYNSETYGTLLGSIVKGTSTSLNITGEYEYIGLCSSSGALYVEEISITWITSGDTPTPPVPSDGIPYINGVAYKMYLTNTQNTATDYYFTGSISNHYGTTSTSYHDGFYVYFENHSSGNGRNLYFYEDNNTANAKKYIYANYVVSNNKTYYNFEFNASEPTNPWTYNSEGGYIQIEASNGQVCIPGTYNQYNTFGMVTYVSATTYTAKFAETAETFSYYLLNKMTCDDTGETEPVFDSNYSWSNLNTLFTSLNTLDSSEANRLVTASASEGGNLIEQAMARYNYLIWKYGENKYNNFIGRNIVSPNLSLTNYVNSGDSNILLIIVAISSVSLCALFVLSYRKRKHN